jgi:hypothetical protein
VPWCAALGLESRMPGVLAVLRNNLIYRLHPFEPVSFITRLLSPKSRIWL